MARETSRLGNMGMSNINGDLVCAIDTETTGLEAGKHDIIELAIVPLDCNFRPITKVKFSDEEGEVPLYPFDKLIKPKRPQNANPDALRVNGLSVDILERDGLEPYKAAEMFETWFTALRLVPGKKIIPLAKNWSFDAGFIKDLVGPTAFRNFFHYRVREVTAVVHFFNDRSEMQGEPRCPFNLQKLSDIAKELDVAFERGHRALDDALVTAECYRRLLLKPIK